MPRDMIKRNIWRRQWRKNSSRRKYVKEWNTNWRNSHREEYRKYMREYQRIRRAKNPTLVAVMNHKRRVRLSEARLKGNFTKEELKNLIQKSTNCKICNVSFLEVKHVIDHIFPLSLGGDNSLKNIQLLCNRCNSSKGNRIITVQDSS